MKNTVFKALLSILILGICTSVQSQKSLHAGLNSITTVQAENYIGFLANDLLEGRDAGRRGGNIAALYIASLLQDWGISPLFETGYYQSFDAYCGTKPTRTYWTTDSAAISKIQSQPAYGHRKMKNILAVIPGSSDECIVIGAHYDHDGINDDNATDCIYNGADDNASGVSAVLQIAKAFKKTGATPRRTLIFAFWDGEEKGWLGSQYFVTHRGNDYSIKAYMNFDMIGRGPVDNPKHLSYIYTASHTMFGDWLKEDMERYKFNFKPEYRAWDTPTDGSDNAPFAKAGIPIVWYHTEGHPDYHRPSDSADKIDYQKVKDITQAAYLCAWRMANMNNL